MGKSILLGASVGILGFIISYGLARSMGIAVSMSFAAMLLIGVVVTYLNLILNAMQQKK